MGVAIRSLLGVDFMGHLRLVPLCGVESDCILAFIPWLLYQGLVWQIIDVAN